MKNHLHLFLFSLLFGIGFQLEATGQGLLSHSTPNFTRQDTLRGTITKERIWWDVLHYNLSVKVNPTNKTINGTNTVRYAVLQSDNRMQIDLQVPLAIYKVTQSGKELDFTRDGNVYIISLKEKQNIGDKKEITISYGGMPKEAINPPWDGGITWSKDANGLDFIASSCQGLGASVWWPCKDHMYDEVEGMKISVNVPGHLMNISNGRLESVKNEKDGTKTFNWVVKNPINNYGVNINIGDYTHFSEKFKGEKGILDCNYYVLKDNLNKAKIHFKDVGRMLQAFEHWFGPYPFYEDSYKLVDAPYLGMEHQSSVTYGNGYQMGYRGRDLSDSGWGLKFDFIIIHESGHEWFANNITYKDVADMWIHESFTNYSESLFVEYFYGKEAGAEYVRGCRKGISNDIPIIGHYNVNKEGSGDMYPKGASMLHTIRQLINDDVKWRSILRGLNETFYHKTVTTAQIENYISEKSSVDLSKVFDQYLRTTMVPTLEYYFFNGKLFYKWTNTVPNFDMQVDVLLDGKTVRLKPLNHFQNLTTQSNSLVVNPDFYVASFKNRD